MGIKNLNALIKKLCNVENIFKNVPASEFASYKIAIDATNQVCVLWSQAYKEVLNRTDISVDEPNQADIENIFLLKAQSFINRILTARCTPIFVFDGKHPAQKSDTQKKRREIKQGIRDKITSYRKELESVDILDRTPKMNIELRKLYGQIVSPSYAAVGVLRNILTDIGIPVLQARGEAEELCSMLCLDGYADAVMSTDTDVLAYSCSLLITGFGGNIWNSKTRSTETHFTAVYLNSILQELKLPFNTFVDLCIMSGCDYNKNIPNIAGGKSYKLLSQYGSIEKLPEKFDTTCLNYEFCRNQFKYKKSSDISDTEFTDLNIKVELLQNDRTILNKYGFEKWTSELIALYHSLPLSKERVVINRPTGAIPRKLRIINFKTGEPVKTNDSNSNSKFKSEAEDFIDSMISDLELNQ